ICHRDRPRRDHRAARAGGAEGNAQTLGDAVLGGAGCGGTGTVMRIAYRPAFPERIEFDELSKARSSAGYSTTLTGGGSLVRVQSRLPESHCRIRDLGNGLILQDQSRTK